MPAALTSRRLAAWAFLASALLIPVAAVLVLPGRDALRTAVVLSPFSLAEIPQALYLGRRLRPRGGPLIWRTALLAALLVLPAELVGIGRATGVIPQAPATAAIFVLHLP